MVKPVNCPACGREVSRIDIRPRGFSCPHCNQPLQVDARYAFPVGIVSLMFGACLSHFLGYSDITFLLYMVLVGAAIFLIAALINRWFFLNLARDDSPLDFRITGPRDRAEENVAPGWRIRYVAGGPYVTTVPVAMYGAPG